MRKDTQAVVLLLAGATLLKIGLTGTYLRYAAPGALPGLLVCGAALVGLAGVTLWQVIRREQELRAARPAQPGPVGHSAERGGRSGVGWLLLLPVLALLIFSPPSLGAYSASRAGTAVAGWAHAEFGPLPETEPVRLPVHEYAARAVFDNGSLAGRRVVLAGFVVPGRDGRLYLTRLVVGCCAADARPVKVGLAGDVPNDLVVDEWIEVEGTYTERFDRDPSNGDIIAYLQVAEFRPILPPPHPYE